MDGVWKAGASTQSCVSLLMSLGCCFVALLMGERSAFQARFHSEEQEHQVFDLATP